MLLKPAEVSELLGLGRSRIYELLACGELPSLRIGRSLRVPVNQLKQWIEDHHSIQSTTKNICH